MILDVLGERMSKYLKKNIYGLIVVLVLVITIVEASYNVHDTEEWYWIKEGIYARYRSTGFMVTKIVPRNSSKYYWILVLSYIELTWTIIDLNNTHAKILFNLTLVNISKALGLIVKPPPDLFDIRMYNVTEIPEEFKPINLNDPTTFTANLIVDLRDMSTYHEGRFIGKWIFFLPSTMIMNGTIELNTRLTNKTIEEAVKQLEGSTKGSRHYIIGKGKFNVPTEVIEEYIRSLKSILNTKVMPLDEWIKFINEGKGKFPPLKYAIRSLVPNLVKTMNLHGLTLTTTRLSVGFNLWYGFLLAYDSISGLLLAISPCGSEPYRSSNHFVDSILDNLFDIEFIRCVWTIRGEAPLFIPGYLILVDTNIPLDRITIGATTTSSINLNILLISYIIPIIVFMVVLFLIKARLRVDNV